MGIREIECPAHILSVADSESHLRPDCKVTVPLLTGGYRHGLTSNPCLGSSLAERESVAERTGSSLFTDVWICTLSICKAPPGLFCLQGDHGAGRFIHVALRELKTPFHSIVPF